MLQVAIISKILYNSLRVYILKTDYIILYKNYNNVMFYMIERDRSCINEIGIIYIIIYGVYNPDPFYNAAVYNIVCYIL